VKLASLASFAGAGSQANALADSGLVAGSSDTAYSSVGSSFPTHAVVWNADGTVNADLGTLAKGDVPADPCTTGVPTVHNNCASAAFGINTSGQVVGVSGTSSGPYATSHAFLWSGGKMTDLGTFTPGTTADDPCYGPTNVHSSPTTYGNECFSEALAINSSGQVVGGATKVAPSTSGSGASEFPFLYSGGHMTQIGAGVTTATSAIAINDSGEILLNNGDVFKDGKLIPAPVYGSLPLVATALDSKGDLLGATGATGGYSTLIYVAAKGKTVTLDSLVAAGSGWSTLIGTAINASGQVVGNAGTAPGKPAGTLAFLLTPSGDHFHVELKAWIPFSRVVDPIRPQKLWWGFAYNYGDCYSPGVFSSDFRTYVSSLYNGNDHVPYAGSYKVISAADFDWDGKQISNFTASTDYGETIRYLEYTVENYITTNSDLVECVIQRAHADSAARAEQVGQNGFRLTYAAAHPIVVAAPAIDATMFGTVAPDGTLSLNYDSDLFPSHGFRVVKNGTTQVTHTISDASCLGSAYGVRGATLIAWGLTHEDNHGTTTVAPGDSGLSATTPSLLCSESYWISNVSDQAVKVYRSFVNPTSGTGAPRSADVRSARAARALTIQIAAVDRRGHPTRFMSLQAASRIGLVLTQQLPSGVGIVSRAADPVAIKVSGVRPEIQESQIVGGADRQQRVYIARGTVTAILGTRAKLVGGHVRRLGARVPGPVTTARVSRKRNTALVRFTARSPVGIVRTFAILAGKPIRVIGDQVRVPFSKLSKLRFGSIDEFGNVENPHGVRASHR
jgi:probable HAF family extracellular repeat protein